MLHRLSRLRGCHIHAVDGEIGHVDDVLVDERTFAVQYLVVDTSNLTKRQREIFDYVKTYAREHGYPPTVRDMPNHARPEGESDER